VKTIQGKILTVIISGLLIMAFAIGAISYYTTNNILHKDADVIIETKCQNEAAKIDEVLCSIKKSVQIMANYALAELEDVNKLSDDSYRHTYNEKMQHNYTNIASNTDGFIGYYIRYNPEKVAGNTVAGFYILSNDNGKTFNSITPTDLSNPGVAPWYDLPKNSGKAQWLSPYDKFNDGILLISYVMPLYVDHEFVGVVGMDVNFTLLASTVDTISVYEKGFAYLEDENGEIVYLSKNAETGTHGYHDDTYTEAVVPLDNGMSLLIHADYDDIQKDRFSLFNTILIIFVVVLISFTFFTVIITNKITKPIKDLASAAEKLAEGDMDKIEELNYSANDEIGTLTTVFKSTAKILNKSMNYMNALAYRDSLTGLKNNTAYTEAVAAIKKRMEDGLTDFGLLVADINKLKHTNDTYGHDVGNQLIICASRTICNAFKHSPVFRIGGDEFVVILEGNDFEKCHELLVEMDDACKETFISAGDVTIPVTIARGIATFKHGEDKSFEDVFNRADQRMYLNKQSLRDS